MADQQVGNIHGVAALNVDNDDQKTNLSGDETSPQHGYFDANLVTVDAMRTRLAAIDAGYYTDARLNTMTFNDMVYAIRVNDNPETIKNNP